MSRSPVLIVPVAAGNAGAAAAFLTEWVISDDADARPYLAGHPAEQGASLIAMQNGRVAGMVCTLWTMDDDLIIWLTKDLAIGGA